MKILVAEDEPVTARLIEAILRRASHAVTVVGTGVDALARLQQSRFDVLVTDWMMPEMDGIELIRRIRSDVVPAPVIIMATAIDLPAARQFALSSGADGFIAKPVTATELLALLHRTEGQLAPVTVSSIVSPIVARPAAPRPALDRHVPCVAVAIATSTGGPDALRKLFVQLAPATEATYFVVVHGPAWMMHSCAEILQSDVPALRFAVATAGMIAQPGHVYLAPGDKHLVVTPGSFALALTDEPMVNFVRPAADPLFESVAAAFDRHCIGVVMTGLGVDGARGASAIAAAGGPILIQDPTSAVAPPMPLATQRAVGTAAVHPLPALGGAVARRVSELAELLRRRPRA